MYVGFFGTAARFPEWFQTVGGRLSLFETGIHRVGSRKNFVWQSDAGVVRSNSARARSNNETVTLEVMQFETMPDVRCVVGYIQTS